VIQIDNYLLKFRKRLFIFEMGPN